MHEKKATQLIDQYGKKIALEIANMILHEHYNYSDPNQLWKGDFNEFYTNCDICKFWAQVVNFIDNHKLT